MAFLWLMGVASCALCSEAVTGSLGSEGNEAPGGGGLGVVRRFVVAGSARFVVPQVITAVGAQPDPRAGGRSTAPLVDPDLALIEEMPLNAFV